jgi:hypothetical protein
MAKMRISIERRNQAALQKRAAENRRNATAELNAILANHFGFERTGVSGVGVTVVTKTP